ncbi:hypothetical protein HRS9139_00845 [Pyrenophora teres f. teres]|uniref:Glycoside hydrolase family 5 protein n=1 Tax=Pyrenophora teres f. teres TaxID=97479 RepID=A0A6S6VM20_9PLEO|nr:hypothetical protein HRS9139_00845 [Pyrenophora teres f. teres]KAE8868343.1 hypothetical protein PTNB29_02254 [Pyrenophora teres f. teres]CAE7023168.1 Glycoside hydrolase family 5 protein [Pyrenophora teres f. teres]
MMILPSLFLPVLVSLVSWTGHVGAAESLRITADHHSFGGVNYPQLQFFTPKHRDDTIREIVKSGARVIRLFIRPDELHPDPESEIGGFDKSMLDQFDDTLAAIHHLSKGQVKAIIAPHDSHALRGTNDVPCDAYCKKLNGAFLDFYSVEEYRELYKTRLDVFFKHYPSKNFDGRSWSTLSEVILGVDIQNQPFSSIWPIPAGESWICDIATHLHDTINLSASSIAVISGGVSGPQSPDGIENFPESVFECEAIDVIGIHGYYSKQKDATAGTPWADMFVPGNTLTARALGDGKGKEKGKLLLVEEWSYMHNEDFGLFYRNEAVWDQGAALNYRGIPWLYSHLTPLPESPSPGINPLHPHTTTWPVLRSLLRESHTTRSAYTWTPYLPPPYTITPHTSTQETEHYLREMLTQDRTKEWNLTPLPLSNITSVPLNPHIIEQSDCTFGCEGHLCDAPDGCRSELWSGAEDEVMDGEAAGATEEDEIGCSAE